MINFDIGSELRDILLSNPNLQVAFANKIFPIVADAGTQFPFIVYRRNSYYKGDVNKDDFDNMFTIELAILTPKYSDSIEILNSVVSTIDEYENNHIRISVNNSTEEFADDIYIQKVVLDIKYNND